MFHGQCRVLWSLVLLGCALGGLACGPDDHRRIGGTCNRSAECGATGVCYENRCYALCATDEDCAGGLHCVAVSTAENEPAMVCLVKSADIHEPPDAGGDADVPATGDLPADCAARCDDGNPCTVDACAPDTGACVNVPRACDDGDPCTDDACDPKEGQCVFVARDCGDDDPCTTDFCDGAAGGCAHTPVACDDGNPCTADACAPLDGRCTHTPADCDDGDPCTDDQCTEPDGGCLNLPRDCDDGDPCTTDGCDPETGACAWAPLACAGHDECAGACDPETGACVYPAGDTPCGGAGVCAGTCDGQGGCALQPGAPDCGPCARCAGLGACEPLPAGAAPLGACPEGDPGCPATCDGAGACAFPAGAACGVCATCDLAGTCVPAEAGSDPRDDCATDPVATCGRTGDCDGAGACARYADDLPCAPLACSAGTLVAAACAAGVCEPRATSCGGYACANESECRGSCAGPDDCAPGYTCVDGSCYGALALGAECVRDEQCGSRHCADGVCCDGACDGLCERCDEAGAAGQCLPLRAGSDPEDECPGLDVCGGTCNGAGGCSYAPLGLGCGPCQACDGLGECVPTPYGSDPRGDCPGDGVCAGLCDGSGACLYPDELAPCGECLACDGAGQCAPIAAGGDPFAQCPAAHPDCAGLCDGLGACAYPAGEALCGSKGECAGLCDGVGNCLLPGPDTACGPCEQCNGAGTCTPVVPGADPFGDCPGIDLDCAGSCDGGGACQYPGATEPCGGLGACAGTCDSGGLCVFAGADTWCGNCQQCDGSGNCQAAPAGSDPFGDCPGGDPGCGASCDGFGDCRYPLGEACAVCRSCDSSGRCLPVAAGSDPYNDCPWSAPAGCDTTGECDGEGSCATYPLGTVCGSDVCEGDVHTTPRCDGASCRIEWVGCGGYVCADATRCRTSCAGDQHCAAGYHCAAGQCVGDQPLGTPCSYAAQCASGQCVDRVCCAAPCNGLCERCDGVGTAGQCLPVGAGLDPNDECAGSGTCGGTCNGVRACQFPTLGLACGLCRACNGAGACELEPVFSDPRDECTGTGTCGGTCDGDGGCQFPTSGVSCGLCQRCNGTGGCAAVGAGLDPFDQCTGSVAACDGACSGLGSCTFPGAQTFCGAATCSGATLSERRCDGAGGCGTVPVNCSPYLCSGAACLTSCATDSQCATGHHCTGGRCVADLAAGAACTLGSECQSDYCVDGVCCATACNGPCERCNQPGAAGSCLPLAAGTDPSNECLGTGTCGGTCNGARACQFPTLGLDCGLCLQCDGAGRCGNVPSGADPNGDCPGDAPCTGSCNGNGACLYPDGGTACGSCVQCDGLGGCAPIAAGADPFNDCAGDHPLCGGTCNGVGRCQFPGGDFPCAEPTCEGAATALEFACDGAGDCAGMAYACVPYLCFGGLCENSCEASGACAPGYYCGTAGQCLPLLELGAHCGLDSQCVSGNCRLAPDGQRFCVAPTLPCARPDGTGLTVGQSVCSGNASYRCLARDQFAATDCDPAPDCLGGYCNATTGLCVGAPAAACTPCDGGKGACDGAGGCLYFPLPLPDDRRWDAIGSGPRAGVPAGCGDILLPCNRGEFRFLWPPDTAQLHCYDDRGFIECPGVGGDPGCQDIAYCGQDAQYGWDHVLPGWDIERYEVRYDVPSQPTVLDRRTGLVWQIGYNGQVNWLGAHDYCLGQGSYGGYERWRVPDDYEQLSLMTQGMTLPQKSFPDQPAIGFWTATTWAAAPNSAWIIDFGSGEVAYAGKNASYAVRCVADVDPLPELPNCRYYKNEDVAGEGLIFDTRTGLLWQRNEVAGPPWVGALQYCEALRFGGFDDWRLPNALEARSIIDTTRVNPALDVEVFNVLSGSNPNWTSTTDPTAPTYAWVLEEAGGRVRSRTSQFAPKPTPANRVRCVRLGP